MKLYAILLLTLSLSTAAFASDFDSEDVSAESDAAVAENQAVKEDLAKEKSAAENAHKAADDVRKSAEAKKQAAIDEMKKSQNEIQSLTSEQAGIKQDIQQMNEQAAAAAKTLEENKAKLAKAKEELKALQQLRAETNKKLVEIAAEVDKTALELKELEHGKSQAAADFAQAKHDSQATGEKLAKMKDELIQKKAQAAIKAESMAPTAGGAVPFGSVAPGETTAAAAAAAAVDAGAPVAEPQRAVNSAATASPGEMTFKKDCKIYDRTTKDPQVLGMKNSGNSIVKTDETKYWIGFALSPSQKGFVAKTCF